MTLTITIAANPADGSVSEQVEEAMRAIGFERRCDVVETSAITSSDFGLAGIVRGPHNGWKNSAAHDPNGPDDGTKPEQGMPSVMHEQSVQEAIKRERGKPAPGRKRRTAEEVAEDEAADKADEAARRAAEDQQISTSPENRVGPEDSPEVQAQDRADEEHERAQANKPSEPVTIIQLTHTDVRNAGGRYINKYGQAAAVEDVMPAFEKQFGVKKMGDLPDDQAKFAEAVAFIDKMTAENPFKRDVVAK